MENEYNLSIIIPHYNTPDLLAKLLDTIPDKKEIQTIVVDDHSSEDVKIQLQKLESEYEGKQILFFSNDTKEHNAGAARNIGLQQAQGEWLLFADADDFFLEGFYEIIEKYFDDDSDIIFFAPTSIEMDTEDKSDRHVAFSNYIDSFLSQKDNIAELNLRYRWLAPWSKLLKRELIQANQITFDSVRVSNDEIFSIKAGFFAKKIDASPQVIYCNTRSKGSLTTKYDLKTFETRTGVRINKYKFLKTHLTKEEFRAFEAFRIPGEQLLIIIRRKYGARVFFKYLKIFRKNKMLRFDVRMFGHIRPRNWSKIRQKEREAKERYQV